MSYQEKRFPIRRSLEAPKTERTQKYWLAVHNDPVGRPGEPGEPHLLSTSNMHTRQNPGDAYGSESRRVSIPSHQNRVRTRPFSQNCQPHRMGHRMGCYSPPLNKDPAAKLYFREACISQYGAGMPVRDLDGTGSGH